MYPIPGHLAMSLAGAHWARLPYGPAIAATFAVDILDKVFADVLAIAPFGRCWFHTLLSVAVCSILIGKTIRKDWGFSWMVGHLLHLVGDAGFNPWFYPFVSYQWPPAPNMVAASWQGVTETFSGGPYSDFVLRIFNGELLLLELLLLFLATALPLIRYSKLPKPVYPLAAVLFCMTLAYRLTYELAPGIDAIRGWVGDWMHQ